MPIIAILTDFGLYDSYVATVKGVILSINPDVKLVDISHLIPQGDIKKAAFSLFTTYKYFPKNTVFLVVIDPGVGSKRKPIIVRTPDYYFVGPDNGVFSWIYAYEKIKVYKIKDVPLKSSNTFHGRDIFAPVAAKLSLGGVGTRLGERLKKWKAFKIPVPVTKDNTIYGEVIDIDWFGNIITNISESDFQCKGGELRSGAPRLQLKINNHTNYTVPLQTSYEGKTPIAIFGSSGFLEISLPNGNCAKFLNAKRGTGIRCHKITKTLKNAHGFHGCSRIRNLKLNIKNQISK